MTIHPQPLADDDGRLALAWSRRTLLDLGGPDPRTFNGNPADGWRSDQRIDAAWLQRLMRQPIPIGADVTPALALSGAMIVGRLDLSDASITTRFIFDRCFFDDMVDLVGATTKTLRFTKCRMRVLDATDCQVAGDLSLQLSRIDTVRLWDATITGNLFLDGASLQAPNGGIALQATNLTLGADMSCR